MWSLPCTHVQYAVGVVGLYPTVHAGMTSLYGLALSAVQTKLSVVLAVP